MDYTRGLNRGIVRFTTEVAAKEAVSWFKLNPTVHQLPADENENEEELLLRPVALRLLDGAYTYFMRLERTSNVALS